jgi:uncharacterized membrane protein YeaQ/YmgE (transglycosylase-associated protein family)
MNLLLAIIIGGIIGWIAARIGGRDTGIIGSIVIGILGSLLGGFIAMALFGETDNNYMQFSWPGLLWSVLGSVILVSVLNVIDHRSHG